MLPGSEAEEAVQEALVRAWRQREACRTPAAPQSWLLQITRNEARRLLQQRALRSSRELVEPEPCDAGSEDERLAGAALRVSVEHAVARLDEMDRRVLSLRYDEDLTQPEVARRLGMAEGTVKIRLHRARRSLRSMLEGDL